MTTTTPTDVPVIMPILKAARFSGVSKNKTL